MRVSKQVEPAETQTKRKASSVRHTRAVQHDRAQRIASVPPDKEIEGWVEEIIKPATYAQVNYFWKLGLRERTLTLPVMMALVLSMIWRQISTVGELVRTVQRESMLWVTPRKLRPQAVSQRLDSLPAELFKQVLDNVLPTLKQRWEDRQRPVPAEIGWARSHYQQVAHQCVV